MDKYPIRATIEGANHGQIVPDTFTYNPIPEGTECIISFKNMKIRVKVDMNFYTNPNFTIIKILEVNYE